MTRRDLRLLLEPARDLERVLAMPLHPQGERLQSAQREETVERPGDRADRVLQKRDLVAELLVFAARPRRRRPCRSGR